MCNYRSVHTRLRFETHSIHSLGIAIIRGAAPSFLKISLRPVSRLSGPLFALDVAPSVDDDVESSLVSCVVLETIVTRR